jgi:hypothetical protein
MGPAELSEPAVVVGTQQVLEPFTDSPIDAVDE